MPLKIEKQDPHPESQKSPPEGSWKTSVTAAFSNLVGSVLWSKKKKKTTPALVPTPKGAPVPRTEKKKPDITEAQTRELVAQVYKVMNTPDEAIPTLVKPMSKEVPSLNAQQKKWPSLSAVVSSLDALIDWYHFQGKESDELVYLSQKFKEIGLAHCFECNAPSSTDPACIHLMMSLAKMIVKRSKKELSSSYIEGCLKIILGDDYHNICPVLYQGVLSRFHKEFEKMPPVSDLSTWAQLLAFYQFPDFPTVEASSIAAHYILRSLARSHEYSHEMKLWSLFVARYPESRAKVREAINDYVIVQSIDADDGKKLLKRLDDFLKKVRF